MNWYSTVKRAAFFARLKLANAYTEMMCQKCAKPFVVDLNQTPGHHKTNGDLARESERIRQDPSLSPETRKALLNDLLSSQRRVFTCSHCGEPYHGVFSGEGYISPDKFRSVPKELFEDALRNGAFRADTGHL